MRNLDKNIHYGTKLKYEGIFADKDNSYDEFRCLNVVESQHAFIVDHMIEAVKPGKLIDYAWN
jgi:hypothetical protein